MRIARMAALVVLACLSGCTSSENKKNPLRARSVDADVLAITKPDGQVIAGEDLQLLGVNTATGVMEPVLNLDAVVLSVLSVGDWIVATVEYQITPFLPCGLIAFPADSAGEEVLCLQHGSVGAGSSGDNYWLHPGIAALGDTLYFTSPSAYGVDGVDIGKTQFKKWTAGSETTELLIELDQGNHQLVRPVLAPAASNVCALAIRAGAAPGQLLCGAAAGASWQAIDTSAYEEPSNTLQIGTKLVTSEYALDLETLVVTPHVAQSHAILPTSEPMTCFLDDGRAIGVNGANELAAVTTTGGAVLFDDSAAWSNAISDGNYCWFYGSNRLQRMSRADGTLDPTNWLGTFGLLQVSDLSFTTEEIVRIDGVDTTGGPVIVYVNSSSGALTSVAEPLERMQQVYVLPQ